MKQQLHNGITVSSQQIEFLLKMDESWQALRDIHWWLILSYKESLWLKRKKDHDLKLGRLTNMKRPLQTLEVSIAAGNCVLIKNMEESIDAVLVSV